VLLAVPASTSGGAPHVRTTARERLGSWLLADRVQVRLTAPLRI